MEQLLIECSLLHVLYGNWMSYYIWRPLTVDAVPEQSVFMVMSCTVWNRSITVSFCDGIVLWQYLLLFSNITILCKNAKAVYIQCCVVYIYVVLEAWTN
jgi:hypothetical protein